MHTGDNAPIEYTEDDIRFLEERRCEIQVSHATYKNVQRKTQRSEDTPCHSYVNESNKGVSCSFCGERFQDENELQMHQLNAECFNIDTESSPTTPHGKGVNMKMQDQQTKMTTPEPTPKSLKMKTIDDINMSPQRSQTAVVTGLKNTANNCYLNAAMQIISNIPGLATNLIEASDRCVENSETEDAYFTTVVGHMLKNIKSEEYTALSLKNLKVMMGEVDEKFQGNKHQDSHEALMLILGKIEEEGKTRIKDLVFGEMQSTLKCTKCSRTSIKEEAFNCLIVDIPPEKDKRRVYELDECIEFTQRRKKVDAICENCGIKDNTTKEEKIVKEPEILLVQLKRFDEEGYKDERFVNYPIKWKAAKRSLVGVIEHSQYNKKENTGHYYAKCLNSKRKKWYVLNDQNARPWVGKIQNNKAYVLVYAADQLKEEDALKEQPNEQEMNDNIEEVESEERMSQRRSSRVMKTSYLKKKSEASTNKKEDVKVNRSNHKNGNKESEEEDQNIENQIEQTIMKNEENTMKRRIEELENKNRKLQQKVDQNKNEKERRDKIIDVKVKKQCNVKTDELKKNQKKIDDLQKAFDEQKIMIANLEEDLQEATKSNKTKTKAEKQLEAEMEEKIQMLESYENRESMFRKIEDFIQKIEEICEKDAGNSEHSDAGISTENDLGSEKNIATKMEEKVKEILLNLEELKKNEGVEKKEKDIRNLKKDLNKKKAEIRNLQIEAESKVQELCKFKTENQRLQATNQNLNESLKLQKKIHMDLERQLAVQSTVEQEKDSSSRTDTVKEPTMEKTSENNEDKRMRNEHEQNKKDLSTTSKKKAEHTKRDHADRKGELDTYSRKYNKDGEIRRTAVKVMSKAPNMEKEWMERDITIGTVDDVNESRQYMMIIEDIVSKDEVKSRKNARRIVEERKNSKRYENYHHKQHKFKVGEGRRENEKRENKNYNANNFNRKDKNRDNFWQDRSTKGREERFDEKTQQQLDQEKLAFLEKTIMEIKRFVMPKTTGTKFL